MDIIIESYGLILSGVIVSIRVFVLSFVLAAVVALLLGILRQTRSKIVRAVAMCWVEFFRGVSTVVLLFWLYFALPFFGVSLSAEAAAILGLGLVHGAYGSEIVRGAMQAVGRDQWEAATSLGYSQWATLRSIILPQALVAMLPPFGNALVVLLKGTSIASIITVPELTTQTTLIVTRTLAVIPVFTCVLLIYYALAMFAVKAVTVLERRVGRWRPRVSGS